jgi:uncharacterized protein (TIGR00369 family)
MQWYSEPKECRVTARVTVPEELNGYPGIVHGGIVAALVDETAGRALLIGGQDEENLFVTAKLEVVYRQPTPTVKPLDLVGWIVRRHRRHAEVAAEVRLEDGTVTAEGRAIVVSPSEQFVRLWEPERQYWQVYDE